MTASRLEVVVARRDVAARDVTRFVLRRSTHGALPKWEPGAHVEVELPGGLLRQYSLCGDPLNPDQYEIAVLHKPDGRGGSRHMTTGLGVGAALSVSAPKSLFPLLPSKRYLFIAGGIGITPIIPMIRAAEVAGSDWTLHYGGRSRQSMAFADDLSSYGDRVSIVPQDEAGLLDLKRLLADPITNTLIYCCGPEPLLQAVEAGSAHWPRGVLRVERFEPKTQANPESAAFQVELRRSGVTLQVPADLSILEAIEDAGIPALSSCGQGTCGTCLTHVIEGEPDHRDSLLDDEDRSAGDKMLICVSRAKSKRLVLDI